MPATDRLRRRAASTPVLLSLIVLLNAAWVAYFGLRMHGLAIYDEKFAVEGARWLHGGLDRLFEVPSFGDRGVERLTAVLFTPAIWMFGSTAGQFQFDHLVMALVFSLQAVPAFLLARDLGAARGWSLFAAALAVFGPYAIFGAVLLNNAPAACAAAFGLWAMWRAVTSPSPAWDALAVALIALAALARVSSVVLVVALPLAILVHALHTHRWADLRRHWLLLVIGVAGAVWLATGHTHTLVGQYPTSVHTDVATAAGRLLTTVAHLSAGTGFVAVVFGAAWIVRQLVRPLSPGAGAFAALAVGWFAALTYVNLASGIDERYELMLFVPLAVAFSVALARREVALVPSVVTAIVVWWALHRHGDIGFTQASDYLTWPSRQWLARFWLNKAQYSLHLGRELPIAVIGLALVAVALAFARVRDKPHTRLVAAIAAFALAWALAGSGWVMQNLTNAERPHSSFAAMSFIDRLTGGERTDAFASTVETDFRIPTMWSEVQYFNRSVGHPLSLEGRVYDLCCGAAGSDHVAAVDHATGALSSDAPLPRYIATVPQWLPAGIASTVVAVEPQYSPPVRLERLKSPPVAAWLSRGFDELGWARPGHPASLRVFPASAAATPACFRVTLRAPTALPDQVAHWSIGSTHGDLPQGQVARVDIPLHGSDPVDLPVSAAAEGPDAKGVPGLIALSDMRLMRCGEKDPS